MDAMVKVSRRQTTQVTDMFNQLVYLKRLSEIPAMVNSQRWDMLLKGPGFRHQLGTPGKHRMRRRKPKRCNRPKRCPSFPFKYEEYDIARKQRKHRRALRKKKEEQNDCVCSGVEGIPAGVVMEMAPKGRNMDQHKDMPRGKRQQLGNRHQHKMRRKKQDRCKPCKRVPYKPPIEYDIKKKARDERRRQKKKKEGSSTCVVECSATTSLNPRYLDLGQGQGQGQNLTTPDAMLDILGDKGMWCKMVPKKPQKDGSPQEGMECDELAPSLVCPQNLLNQKPYPKYRKAMKKRLKKEKELEKKRRAIRRAKEKAKEKTRPKKKAAGLGSEEAVAVEFLKPGILEPSTSSTLQGQM